MKDAILFVAGRYRAGDLDYYHNLCRGKTLIAVDGGYSFFKKTKITPDYVIGDMDSTVLVGELSRQVTVITFPPRKDKTDSQLAVEYCIEQGARSIDVAMPSPGQPDHFIANFLLPTVAGVSAWVRQGGKFRIVGRSYEVSYIVDGEAVYSNCIDHIVSVIPLSKQIVLSCDGTDYDVVRARIPRGHTRALRNRVTSRRAVLTITGEALVWHLFR